MRQASGTRGEGGNGRERSIRIFGARRGKRSVLKAIDVRRFVAGIVVVMVVVMHVLVFGYAAATVG